MLFPFLKIQRKNLHRYISEDSKALTKCWSLFLKMGELFSISFSGKYHIQSIIYLHDNFFSNDLHENDISIF